MGSHQTAGSSPAPRGISPLAWFSRNRPHCLRRITATGPLQRSDVRLDGSIIVPASAHGRYREPPGTDSRLFLAPCQSEQAKDLHTFFSVVSCCSYLADSRAAAVRALAFAKEAGMCMRFSRCGERSLKNLSPLLPLGERFAQHYSKSFFSFLRILVFRTWMAFRYTPSSSAYCRSVFSSKNNAWIKACSSGVSIARAVCSLSISNL